MFTDTDLSLWGLFILGLGAIHPEAAAGAICGGFFFWSMSPDIPVFNRLWLLAGSVGLGYGTAVPAAVSDNGWAWIIAGVSASLVHVVLVALRTMVDTGSPWPPWLRDIVDAVPFPRRKNRGENHDQR